MSTLLFRPIDLRGLTPPDRIVVEPMMQFSAHDGTAGDWHLMHLGQYAVSGAGLVLAESTYVAPQAREITLADITEIRDAFVSAARRAHLAWADLIELHCAHGYLMHQFLSPLSNRRVDRQAETILMTGQADMIGLARAMLYDPRWPWHAAHELGVKLDYPRQYERAHPSRKTGAGINAPGNVAPPPGMHLLPTAQYPTQRCRRKPDETSRYQIIRRRHRRGGRSRCSTRFSVKAGTYRRAVSAGRHV